MADLADQVDELATVLGISRKQARKALMRQQEPREHNRLTYSDPTPREALRNIERANRAQKAGRS